MITEDYVSFETAKLLKEKGFDAECKKYYNLKMLTNLYYGCEYVRNRNLKDEDDCIAPSLGMAMKWLREVHNIHINLDIHWLHFANQNGWMYIITKILENGTDYVDSKGDENDKHFYSTYEHACDVAIKYCLKRLI